MAAKLFTKDEIFNAAAEIADADERAAYLQAACGNDLALKNEIQELLDHDQLEDSLLDRSIPGIAATICQPIAERPGMVIGPYKLLQQIGEGGMGVVFMAEQVEPIQRTVALKIIKAGMDTRQVIARFEAERQALAMMDHPNIARVLDAGTTDPPPLPLGEGRGEGALSPTSDLRPLTSSPGRPYFVMELVKGVPITKYCDEKQLSLSERLELFMPVCQAVQHAHQKGIIHRDIKPTNVLVAEYDNRAVPKVIDFGVAKATAQKLTERTMFTEFGQVIGTVEYMSPEQAKLNQLDIDTRSDIYSLGVLLYELLTGSTPFEQKRLREAAFDEVLRIIREEEPPKPSTRLSSLSHAGEGWGEGALTLASIAANRHAEPARLSKDVRGELDWIVMKCLEKDRGRRYETANGFAADIRRYLNDEPVQACPPSPAYRFRKFARRNKVALVTASMVMAALLVGTALATWQAIAATRAKQDAVAAADAEKRAKQTAEARETETRAVLDFVEDKVFAAAGPEGQDGGMGHDITLRKAIESALRFVDESFTDQPLIEARLRWTLGISFLHLGEARIAVEQFERVRALYTRHYGPDHPDTLTSMTNLASTYSDLGRDADALKLREETLARYQASRGGNHPHTLATMNDLAGSYYSLGQYAEALKLWQETLGLRKAALGPDHPDTLGSMANLASGYEALGQHGEALQLREETLALYKAELGPDHAVTLKSMHNLAKSYDAVGRKSDALKLHEETLALFKAKLGPEHADTLKGMGSVATSYFLDGRYADALKLHEDALALWNAKFGPDHSETLGSMQNVALSNSALHRQADALRLREEALALWKSTFGADHPHTLRSMNDLAHSYAALGRDADALKLREETLALMTTKLGPDHPDTLWNMANVAGLYVFLGRHAEALPIIDDCLARAVGKTVPPQLMPLLLGTRLSVLQMKKDPDGCLETVDKWEALNRTDAPSLYYSARFRAYCAAVIREVDKTSAGDARAKAQADQAMVWLKQAVAAGYKDIECIKIEKNLDVLRDREDFKKLLAELERNDG